MVGLIYRSLRVPSFRPVGAVGRPPSERVETPNWSWGGLPSVAILALRRLQWLGAPITGTEKVTFNL